MNKALFTIILFVLTCYQLTLSAQEAVPTIAEPPMIDYSSKPSKYIIRDIKVSGVQYLNPEFLISSAGLNKGDSIYLPGNHLSEATKKLWNQRYFSDVKIETEIAGDSVDIEIFLMERPRVYRWSFEGGKKGEMSTLRDELKLRRGSELSDYILEKNIYLIEKFYIDKGFRNVEVTPRIDNDTSMNNAVNVTFVIDKKNKVKIGEINFHGNQEFSDKRLRKTMKKTHQKSINFFRNSKLKEVEFEEDKENILDFYNSRGYRNAVILRDSIYPINEKRIGIDIDVSEGNKFYLRNISWVGNSKFETEYLKAILNMESGDIYDKKTLQKRLGIGRDDNPDDISVNSLYQNDGYLMSQIDPTEIIIGEDSIDLEIKIFEGRQFTINNVNISGNYRVNDEVIRRELYTRPGELYNRALIMQTMRQLAQMEHFDQNSIFPGIAPVTNELVDISWALSETGSDKIEISGGWGSGMFVGAVGLQLKNISLKNFFKKGAWRPYPSGQNQQLIIRAQSNGTYYKAFSLGFIEPWFGGKKPNSLNVSMFYSEETNAYTIFSSSSAYFRSMGVAIGTGRRLSWPDQYFTLYNELSYQSYKLKNWNYFMYDTGRSNIISLRTVFARNSVDQPIFPRRGSEFMASLTLTPPYSLFDNKDYKNMEADDPDLHKWIEFHKWEFKAQWYYPLSRNNNLVLMAKAEMGYLGHYNKNKLSPFEGFDVGGDGMSGYNVYGVDIIGLRGYKDGAITPYSSKNDYARLYNKYTVELRYPFLMQPMSQIYGLVFAEGGNAFSSWKEFDPFKLKRSIGFGARIYLPMIGMLGVDWGYGFDRPVGSNKRNGGEIHFMIGNQF